MATTYVAVKRRGKKAWVVGAVTDNLEFLGKSVDLTGTSQISLHETVESAHTKDNMGGNALTTYSNLGMTGNITLVYTPGEKPRAGDIVVYTDPDDGGAQKALQITDTGVEINNGMQAASMPVTVEWYAAWGDDAEVIAAAPELGSKTEALHERLRLRKRVFTENENIVSLQMTYEVFEEDDDGPIYSLSGIPKSIPLLQHRCFRGKKITNNERVIAQEYINGGTDSTVLFYKEDGEDIIVADSVPDAEKSKWTQATLRALVKKYTPDSTAVKLARNGTKSLPSPALTWTEVKTSKFKPAVEGLGERASPRGDNPTGHRWILKSIDAAEIRDKDGETRYKITTVWETDDYPDEND